MSHRRILVTSPPLNRRDEFLNELVELASKENVEVSIEVYRVFDYMKDVGEKYSLNVTRENVLDLSPEQLNTIRDEAIDEIVSRIKKRESEANRSVISIISSPAIFRIAPSHVHPEGLIKGLSIKHIEKISPNEIYILVDDLINVKKRLLEDSAWRGRIEPRLNVLATWRKESIDLVLDYIREIQGKYDGKKIEWLVFSVNHPVRTFLELLLKEKPKIYLSFPITGVSLNIVEREVSKFSSIISRYFVVLNPLTIKDWDLITEYEAAFSGDVEAVEINGIRLKLEELQESIDLIRSQVVERDISMVRNSNAVIVYHYTESASYGVFYEVMEAARLGKPIYVYFPSKKKRLSPFFEYVVQGTTRRIFYNWSDKNDDKMLENFILSILNDVCRDRWLTWKLTHTYKEKYCRETLGA
ncbi:MAG: hypothetical protein ACP5LZ_06505 [Fervidicoccaceae archaeon]